MRVAAIDIGSVTTRLMIAEVSQGVVRELYRELAITDLGKGLAATGKLDREGIERVFEAVQRFTVSIAKHDVEVCACVATSATRDASNSDRLVARLQSCGIDIRIIDGNQEAALSFAGATYGAPRGANVLVVDPGGGSTELTWGMVPTLGGSVSVDVGSRRLTDMFIHTDPPTQDELEGCRRYIETSIQTRFHRQGGFPLTDTTTIMAVAGTATTMATVMMGIDSYDPSNVHGFQVSREDISAILTRFCEVDEIGRAQIPGLEPKRAPMIIAGILIIEAIFEITGVTRLTISDHDLLYGIMLEAARR